jgi:hypothetical protein
MWSSRGNNFRSTRNTRYTSASSAGSCVWHAVGVQCSEHERASREDLGERPVRQEQAMGILVAALGMLASS